MPISVNGRFALQRITGVQRYAHELTSRIGAELSVVTPRSSGAGVRGHLWEQGILPARVRGDLLWSPCNTGPLTVPRQVVTIHDCGFFDQANCYSPKFARWYQWLIPRLAKRARKVITVSEFSRQRLLQHTGVAEERVVVIPNGVGRQFSVVSSDRQAEVRERLKLPSHYVLYVGSLEPRKNLTGLLEAWRQLPVTQWGLSLVLVGGSGGQFQSVNLVNDLPSVVVAGYVSDTDLPAVYAAAELFVYPSLYEGFGLPVLEAMACGTPVVCSNSSALPEAAADAGVLVDPHDPAAIAEGMRRVIDDPALQAELRQRGLQRARDYTWDRAAGATWQLLQATAEDN